MIISHCIHHLGCYFRLQLTLHRCSFAWENLDMEKETWLLRSLIGWAAQPVMRGLREGPACMTGHLVRTTSGRLSSGTVFWTCCTWRRVSRWTLDSLERIFLTAGLGTPLCLPRRAGRGSWGGGVCCHKCWAQKKVIPLQRAVLPWKLRQSLCKILILI